MQWGRKQLTSVEYAPYVAQLEKLQLSHPRQSTEFMMVSIASSSPGQGVYFVGTPTSDLFRGFEGFELIEEMALPREVNAVFVADQTKHPFKSRFILNVDRPARKKVEPSA